MRKKISRFDYMISMYTSIASATTTKQKKQITKTGTRNKKATFKKYSKYMLLFYSRIWQIADLTISHGRVFHIFRISI